MGVYELSGAGSVKTGRTLYTSMNAGNQYGAMVPIASSSFTGGIITFTSIPQTYQDLYVVVNGRSTLSAAVDVLDVQFNSDGGAGSLYSHTRLLGDGSTVASARSSSAGAYYADYYFVGNTATAGIFSSNIFHIFNYANTSTFKTTLSRSADDRNGAGATSLSVGLWRNTNAITSVSFFPDAGVSAAFASGTTITLYGIRAVSS